MNGHNRHIAKGGICMYLKENVDIIQFLSVVKKCGEDVFLETVEGDRLNLKSTLSQYVFVACANGRGFLDKARIICTGEDAESLQGFLAQ